VVPSAFLPRNRSVELLVIGHDQVRVARDQEPRDVDVLGAEGVEFGEQHRGVYDDAVADHRHDGRVEHPRGHELECEGLAVHDDAVSGVVAALVTNDHVHVTSEEVGQLPLALVTPLGSDYDGCGHWTPSRRPRCGSILTQRNWCSAGYWKVMTPCAWSTVMVSPSR
jgi:hypothetical protein